MFLFCSSRKNLLDLGVENTLGKNLLWNLGSHISISQLSGNVYTSNLLFFGVNLVDLHLDTSLSDIESLVILVEELIVTLLSRLKTRKSNSHIVTSGSTTSLGVKEESSTVRRSGGSSSHLESRLEGRSVSNGLQLLDSEKEWNTLTSGKLNGGGGVVNTFFLLENNVSSLTLDGSLNSIEGVCLTGHDLGVNEFLLGLSGLSNLFLNGPGLWLNAHINKTRSRLRCDTILSDNLRTTVGKSSSLDLKVGKLVKLGLGDGLSGLSDSTNSDSSDSGGTGNLGGILLHTHKLGTLGLNSGRGEGGGGGNEGGSDGELHFASW
mmetsp:Transcript_20385/g.26348  ORF Transcript_20385/g.26348 Transcript_20385/m.26348 type:complete len:321 (-) Transcript_20385:63-1025(-)